jgi:hypothetical protein
LKKLGVSRKVGVIDGLTNIITYYINRKEGGWVQQTMLIRVYIEMKVEVTTCHVQDEEKKHDAFVCVYCKRKFSNELHINDHQIQGCPNGPLDANGVKISLLVYSNLQHAQQSKDFKNKLGGITYDLMQKYWKVEELFHELNP